MIRYITPKYSGVRVRVRVRVRVKVRVRVRGYGVMPMPAEPKPTYCHIDGPLSAIYAIYAILR